MDSIREGQKVIVRAKNAYAELDQRGDNVYLSITDPDQAVAFATELLKNATAAKAERDIIKPDEQEILNLVSGTYGNDWNALDLIRTVREYDAAHAVPKRCGKMMLGSGDDTYDPCCELPKGHGGPCLSTSAIDQHKISEDVLRGIWESVDG